MQEKVTLNVRIYHSLNMFPLTVHGVIWRCCCKGLGYDSVLNHKCLRWFPAKSSFWRRCTSNGHQTDLYILQP